jgi:UDP-glucose 4-epimerase
MNVLVTGGAGFIGSHLAECLLKSGHDVMILDNLLRGNKLRKTILSNVELVRGDVRDKDLVMKLCKNKDVIFHLAAILGVDIVADNPMETMEVETNGLKNIVEGALLAGVNKIVYTSTSGVYGKKLIDGSVTEDVHLDPASSYSIAKRYNEIYLTAVYHEKRIAAVSARLFNVYGQRQDERMVIPRFVEQAIANEPITVYGSGAQTRDFTYVEECVDCLVELANTVTGSEIFNISRGEDITILEVAEEIKKLFNSKSEIVKMGVPKSRYDFEVEKRCGNSDKLFKHIGCKPVITFYEGLRLTYNNEHSV